MFFLGTYFSDRFPMIRARDRMSPVKAVGHSCGDDAKEVFQELGAVVGFRVSGLL